MTGPTVARALAIAGASLVLLSFPSTAGAHAALDTSVPRWRAVLAVAPRSLRLVYDENVVPRYARVSVIAPGGENLAGRARVAGSTVVAPLRTGGQGSYTVRWQMVASDDGHVTEGAFTYGVRAEPLPPVPAPGVGVPVAPELLAWLQFLGVVLAGGVLTIRALVWAPAARLLGDAEPRDARAALWAGVIGAVLALHAAMAAFLVGAYPIVGGGLGSFADAEIVPIRLGTHLGQAWVVMTFAWLAVLALLVGAWVAPRRREALLASAGLLSLGIGFGLSWASHPASRGTLALAADYVHLLAGALWVGGVVALVILAAGLRPLSGPARETMIRASVLRFSRLAVPIVVVLALAGAYLALRQLPAPSALFASAYGATVVAKTIVFIAAASLGGYHRISVVPRLAAGAAVGSMRRTLALELSLLLVALALAAILSQTAPPR
ncbi:MAG TPA: CopD family protein [Solirubrobacteraceae bacterium]|jgi:copper transport protein|nr:CopD family protein [Solirubrobacteraceae bacterium]